MKWGQEKAKVYGERRGIGVGNREGEEEGGD